MKCISGSLNLSWFQASEGRFAQGTWTLLNYSRARNTMKCGEAENRKNITCVCEEGQFRCSEQYFVMILLYCILLACYYYIILHYHLEVLVRKDFYSKSSHILIIIFYFNILNVIFLWCKAEISAVITPVASILWSICWFGTQETFLLISDENSFCGLSETFFSWFFEWKILKDSTFYCFLFILFLK